VKMQIRPFILIPFFAALSAAGSFIKLPFYPIPITLQTLMVYLSGLVLGPAGGALSQAIYVALGLMGLPIFAAGGGIAYIFSPTFGYLVGFIAAAAVAGWFSRKEGWVLPTIGVILALLVVYIFGVPYLYGVMNLVIGKQMSLWGAIKIGFFITVFGDMIKAGLALGVFYSVRERLGLPLARRVSWKKN
jgi:biotin transport system substrate-specific component